MVWAGRRANPPSGATHVYKRISFLYPWRVLKLNIARVIGKIRGNPVCTAPLHRPLTIHPITDRPAIRVSGRLAHPVRLCQANFLQANRQRTEDNGLDEQKANYLLAKAL